MYVTGSVRDRFHYDPVAQLDRVSVSEAGGHEFESHRDHHAKVAKLVDALASGASTARREGSSPSFRTKFPHQKLLFFGSSVLVLESLMGSNII